MSEPKGSDVVLLEPQERAKQGVQTFTIDRAAPSIGRQKPAVAIYRALESPNYKWRTIHGVAKEAGVDEAIVRQVIDMLGDRIVRSSIPSTTGEALYTTRRHHRQRQSVLARIGAALKNRGA